MMSDQPIRFLHVSDLRLDTPLCGLETVPEHLWELLLQAPLDAAQGVFDAALEHEVDFLAVAGDLIDVRRSGPRVWDFLLGQLERLCQARVPVFWAAGIGDAAQHWPGWLDLPPNVHRFESTAAESATVRRAQREVATIVGSAATADGRWHVPAIDRRSALPTIALVAGPQPVGSFEECAIGCWALGGRSSAQTVASGRVWAGYSGTHQGRGFDEPGCHGATLVEMDAHGRIRHQLIPTDVARWHDIALELPASADRDCLLHALQARTHALQEESGGRQSFVRWHLVDGDQLLDTRGDALAGALREGKLADELLLELRRESGMSIPGVWHAAMQAEAPRVLPTGWYAEETVLGDVLRAIQALQHQRETPLPWEQSNYLAELPDAMREQLALDLPHDRDWMLRHLAALSVDLLRGDRVLSEECVLRS